MLLSMRSETSLPARVPDDVVRADHDVRADPGFHRDMPDDVQLGRITQINEVRRPVEVQSRPVAEPNLRGELPRRARRLPDGMRRSNKHHAHGAASANNMHQRHRHRSSLRRPDTHPTAIRPGERVGRVRE
jgi:hypothetical protein